MNQVFLIRFLIGLSFVLLFVCCRNKPSNKTEYSKDENGFYYKLLSIGDGKQKPKKEDVVEIDAVMRTQSDSVFWDSFHDIKNEFYVFMNSEFSNGSFHSYLANLVEGDSASFLENPSVCFKSHFQSEVPYFCAKDSMVRIDIKIKRILSRKQYLKQEKKQNSTFDLKRQENAIIMEYITKLYPSAQLTRDSIYILEKLTTQLQKVSVGKQIKIQYQGFLLDGKPIDNTSQQLEFVYGTPDQILKGLNIVIGTLKKGEFTKIVIPSHLAFGEEGNSNGSIPPYTPLVYNIKLIDIK